MIETITTATFVVTGEKHAVTIAKIEEDSKYIWQQDFIDKLLQVAYRVKHLTKQEKIDYEDGPYDFIWRCIEEIFTEEDLDMFVYSKLSYDKHKKRYCLDANVLNIQMMFRVVEAEELLEEQEECDRIRAKEEQRIMKLNSCITKKQSYNGVLCGIPSLGKKR